MNILGVDFTVKNDTAGQFSITARSSETDFLLYDICLHFDQPTTPSPVSLSFALPYHGISAVLTSAHMQSSYAPLPEWMPITVKSRLSFNSPMIHCVGYDDINRYTVAIADVNTPITLSAGVIEESGMMRFTIQFFTARVTPLSDYHTVLYIDKRQIPYHHALQDVEGFWQAYNDASPCHVPEAALHPLYSFWYSYHQKFTTEEIIAECARAKSLGMNTAILDDGWQTEDNGRGYAYCGDWEIASTKIPDVRRLADEVHAIGMKLLFWFSVPYMGKYAEHFKDFEGMYLDGGEYVRCLDPRFPVVRQFLIGKWVRAMKEWDLDGLKLDFIDAMRLTADSATDDPRMDAVSLEAGIEKLLSEAYAAITAIKPDALIEYRQAYIGPTVQCYGNMLRVADCPNDAHSNRTRAMQLRLLTHSTAIHSDMLMWNQDESAEFAARQISAVLFTVPQISVRLDTISQEQREMLNYYLRLWEKHRDVLLNGELYPHCPDCHFPLIEAETEKERFAVSYTEGVWRIKDGKPLFYINATKDAMLYLHFAHATGTRRYRICDCRGRCVEEGVMAMRDLLSFPVPLSGTLEIF